MKKIANILLTIFSIGVLLTVVAGGVAIIGYIIAMCIGGDIAVGICQFIKEKYFPLLITGTSIFVACGLAGMYFDKKKALVIEKEDIHNAVNSEKK